MRQANFSNCCGPFEFIRFWSSYTLSRPAYSTGMEVLVLLVKRNDVPDDGYDAIYMQHAIKLTANKFATIRESSVILVTSTNLLNILV